MTKPKTCYVILFINSNYDDRTVMPLKVFMSLPKAKKYLAALIKAAIKDKTLGRGVIPVRAFNGSYDRCKVIHSKLCNKYPRRYPLVPCVMYGVNYELEVTPFSDS